LFVAIPVLAQRSPVLVELFTSEGCSSCPPADALLIQLAKTQPVAGAQIIVLGAHVDYWNQLGWKDPFSSAEFSARQSRYSDAWGEERVYTPQMVVDGRAEFAGGNRLQVRVEDVPAGSRDTVEVLLAITEANLQSSVARGENSGRSLAHTGVVRRLEVIGIVKPGTVFSAEPKLSLAIGWKRENLRGVVFLQERCRRVLGAAVAPLG
jgi:hypothetical protein